MLRFFYFSILALLLAKIIIGSVFYSILTDLDIVLAKMSPDRQVFHSFHFPKFDII